jgi:hypothetical protein
VRAEGRAINHGIFRDFPLTFRDGAGGLHEVTFELLGVTRDGKPESYFTQRRNNILRIYAGDKETLIPRGEHTYVLRYRTGRQIRWFDGKPELNWNVTGNFWNFPIFAARYRLHLAGGARPLQWTAFTGPVGARGTEWRGSIDDTGVLTVSTTQRLAPREGLTVVAALPAGAVEPPSAATRFWWSIRDNRRWIFGAIGFAVVLVYYLAAWNAAGRDPRSGTIIPLFHPPKGISPGLANYIHNWGLSREKWRAFTAAALSLAVRGLVRFEQKEKALTLKSTGRAAKDAFTSLPPGEGVILSWIDRQGGTAEVDRAHGTEVAEVGGAFTSGIERENRGRFFRRNFGYVIAGVAMTIGAVAVIVIFGGLRDEDIAIIFAGGFGGLWLGVLLMPLLVALFGPKNFAWLVRLAITLFVVGILFSLALNVLHALFPKGLGDAIPMLKSLLEGYPFPIVLVTAFAALNGLFIYLMRAPTALGRPIMDQLAGLRLYLETAEADRLNFQAPEITAERFEALLPYAVALDVEKPWSAAFAAALRRAHPEESDPMRHYQPTWTAAGANWSTSDFSSVVSGSVSAASAALASAVPASSGSSGFSSGGGGSGGGGGGGGGGGW